MIGGGSRRRRRTRRRERKRKRWSTRIREGGGGGGEETKRTTFSRGRIAEEVQTGLLHLHNRYIPAAWTDVEAESSVSSVRYIARLALARDGRVWRSLSRDRWEEGIKRQKEKERRRERENEQREGFEESRREEGRGGGWSSRRAQWRSARGAPEETSKKREKRRREYPTTDDIIGAQPYSSHSPGRSVALPRVSLSASPAFSRGSRPLARAREN